MKLANYERYCIQFKKYDHIFDGQCRVKIKRLHLKGIGEGGVSFCNLLCETNPWHMLGNRVIEETTGQNSSCIKSFKISLTLAH